MLYNFALSNFLNNVATYVCYSVCNVRKLHRPRMSDAFLADNVNRTSASLHSCTTAAMFSEFHDELANLESK